MLMRTDPFRELDRFVPAFATVGAHPITRAPILRCTSSLVARYSSRPRR
jgi:hypothetical protein